MTDSPTRRESNSIPIGRSADVSRRASTARLAASPFHPGSLHGAFHVKRTDSSSSSVFGDDRASLSNNVSRGRPMTVRQPVSVFESRSRSHSRENNVDEVDSGVTSDNDNANLLLSSSYGTTIDDAAILKNVGKHLHNDPHHSLKSPGGDITRDLYTLSAGTTVKPLRRSKSLTGSDLNSLGERRGSTASQIRLPGGFRREFLVSKKYKFGHELEKPTFITRNFLEFLSIYGHFAGEDLEDEDYLACDYVDDSTRSSSDEESAPLLSSPLRRSATHPEHKGTASTMKAFFLLMKSFVGTGVLFLPRAFYNGGLLFCILTLLFFGILSYWCYYILVQSKIATGVSSFGDIGSTLYGKQMKILILFSIVLSQIGFVAAYTIFTAENLKAFIKNFFGLELSVGFFVVVECFVFMPMSLFRNITKLSLAALMANIFILGGLITIVYFSSLDLIANGPADVAAFNHDSWSLFIGVAIFAFEGIGLIIPVQESMAHPEQYPAVLFAVIAVCSVLFIGVGSLGYITYGSDVQTVVILNLPQDSLAVNCIQFFYALAILLSAPLQLLPAIRIIESRVFKKHKSGKYDPTTKWKKNGFRVGVVMGTTAIAYLGSENLDQFVSFVGSFACIPLVYMYPPMLHYKSVAISWGMKLFDACVVVLGGVAMLYTTYQILTG